MTPMSKQLNAKLTLIGLILLFSLGSFGADEYSFDISIFTDINKALSGDVVGNGSIIEDDWNVISNGNQNEEEDDLFLKFNEREKRNNEFNSFLQNFGIDPAHLRGGDVVGNGGGLLEGQAYFYYHSLENHLLTALEQNAIEFSADERKVLQRILKSLPDMEQEGKIIFLDPSEYRGFFFTPGVDTAPRVAKTGHSMDFPIFINTSMVYKRIDGDLRFWLGTLVHELGHQVGIANHLFLEELGAKVISTSELSRDTITAEMGKGSRLEITSYNHYFIDGSADLFVSYNSQHHVVRDWDKDELRQVCGRHYFAGLLVDNLHWTQRALTDMSDGVLFHAGGWATIKCLNSQTGTFNNRHRNFKLEVYVGDGEIQTKANLE